VTDGFVTVISVVSLVLLCGSMVLVYWRSSKLSFKTPMFDLSMAMLFCVAALFLSYRIICEQWFVWAIPFLVILSVGSRVRRGFVWGVSLLALLYSVLNCPLPFFFLPLAPWLSNSLVGMVHFVWWVESLRVASLVALGLSFSLLLLLFVVHLSRNRQANQ
jgi:hypothetical protein